MGHGQYAASDSLLRGKPRRPPNVTPAGQRKSIFADDCAQATRPLNLRHMQQGRSRTAVREKVPP
jgi:hypothetical protein